MHAVFCQAEIPPPAPLQLDPPNPGWLLVLNLTPSSTYHTAAHPAIFLQAPTQIPPPREAFSSSKPSKTPKP